MQAIETIPSKPRSTRSLPSLVVGLVLGLAVGTAVLVAHVTGRLTPVYHALGLHSMHPTTEERPEGAGQSMPGHAGHGGMSMPRAAGTGEPSGVPGYAIVSVSPERQQLIGVRKGPVVRDKLLMSIRAVGIIEPDQTRLARIQTRVSGWVTKVHANFVGQDVKQGDALLEIYSPDLLATQEEYLVAVEGGQRLLADSARRRLELWGVPPDQIKQLENTKKARETLTLRSPINGRVLERQVLEGTRVEPTVELYRIADLSVVWLQAKVYEYEVPHVEIGQPVFISLLSHPEAEFRSKVAFVEPVFQETSRTVKVRIVLDNPKDEFKPGMYADLRIEHDMGEGLLVPDSALLRTGERTLAFRVLPEGRFEPVAVKVGARFGDRLQVLSGLEEGDEVVTSAGFLIDSESRLKAVTGTMGGHQHGSSAQPQTKSRQPAPATSGDKKPGAEHEHHHHHE
jgi:Cu(I)/Ag(I) efflux system membrane fusion protein